MTPTQLDKVAQAARKAFHEASYFAADAYVAENPWKSLTPARKDRWRAVVKAAVQALPAVAA